MFVFTMIGIVAVVSAVAGLHNHHSLKSLADGEADLKALKRDKR